MQTDQHSTKNVWNHYVYTRKIPRDVLRESIQRAWQRCDQVGASPFIMQARELTSAQAKELFEREGNLIQAAKPYMQALSQAAGDERHAAMLGDRNAVVIDVLGDEESVSGRQRVPGPGALLAEQQAGANGIGSPLAEGGYIELVGSEHFIEGFHPFTCQGLPLTGPNGEIAGVLSTSVRRVEASHRIREILYCAAHGIEAELIRRQLSMELQQMLGGETNDALLDRIQQDMVQMHGAARLRLEKAIRLVRANRHAEVTQLVEVANQLITRFRMQSQLWREIASAGTEEPRRHDLAQHAREMAALLATEAAVRGLDVVVHGTEPVPVHVDRRELQRTLFRAFLRAFESSPARSTLRIDVANDEQLALGTIRFSTAPDVIVAIDQKPRQFDSLRIGSFVIDKH
ncbi:sigma-54-dependent transcriptional regulator family protein [Noviherbaspirillum pedocola]|uniref:GAF domain-containing protein n=1 Tax=Noviherbaspirillum pedocola TaxID=2801341 RepID=A0A934SYN0_9BURK|nr:hypothetical protein [Noviherbaspirillum pedocola]MBK4735332.1 hypothetical protein [Noviherbaspirillum pedocola]